MAKRKSLQQRLDDLEALASRVSGEELATALDPIFDRGPSPLVAKAAGIAADAALDALAPALASAFERFMIDPEGSDKSCRAKTAIADALRRLWYEDEALFLRGVRHRQHEPVWGGTVDTACPLRATCIGALAEMGYHDVLIVAGDLLADPEAPVRLAAAQALGAAEISEGEPLLRLKSLLGDDEVDVTQACFEALLRLPSEYALDFVESFLDRKDAATMEAAAYAIGGTRTLRAFEVLRGWYDREILWERSRVALVAIALCRHEAAIGFVLNVVAAGSEFAAADAVRALAVHAPDDELKRKTLDAAAQREDSALDALIAERF